MLTINLSLLSIMLIVFVIEIGLTIKNNHSQALLKDVRSNVLLGAMHLVAGFLSKGLAYTVHSACYYLAFFKPDVNGWLWFGAFTGNEFCHYAYHWLGHKTKFFWASHVTHHSSEFFNMSTGFRTNFIHIFYRFLFWSPLCLLGIPPEMVMLIESITATQNFLIHTERIGKLGWLDYAFTTPSNHRVHHAKNALYIDKNLGGLTVVFDHLFGTFQAETEKPVYGITHALPANDPGAILLSEYRQLARDLPRFKGIGVKLKYLFSRPL